MRGLRWPFFLNRFTRKERFIEGSPEAAVEAVLQELRPAFRADGGDLTLIRITPDGRVVLRAHGSCHGCGASALTLQGAIAPKLKASLPFVTGVELEEDA